MGLTITKEKIRDLSAEVFHGEIVVIDKVEDVTGAIEYLKQVTNKVALMQLSTLDKCFLFRLNLIQYPDELDDLICSKDVKKIGLSLRDDFAALRKRTDCAPLNFIDLQTFVQDYGIKDMSLQKIYAILFNKKISKNQRLSNWEAKRLKESQKMYAAIDAWACLRIYNYLKQNGAPAKAE